MNFSDVSIESAHSGELMIAQLAGCVTRMVLSVTGEGFWMMKSLGAYITNIF